jgi:hypothetical protein
LWLVALVWSMVMIGVTLATSARFWFDDDTL